MEIKNELILQPVPEVGKVYHAFDDGKIRPTRHMLVRVDDVIPNAHMKPWMKAVVYYESLKHDWLFNGYTDYVVKCTWTVENKGKSEDRPLWFIRTKDGGWFCAEVDNYMDGCVLDVTGKLWNDMIEYYHENCSESKRQEFDDFVFENTIYPKTNKIAL